MNAAASPEPPAEPGPPIPAATVVLLRDGSDGIETLMLRRNSKLAFAGGMWVWPGGRVDPDDIDPDVPDDPEVAARRAAARETFEEAGLSVDPASLAWFAHWTPPPIRPTHRFATYFFAGQAPLDAAVTVDGGEIHDHLWITPREAMRRRNALEIELAPPTWITLEYLARYQATDVALVELEQRPAEYFATRIAFVEGGAVALYHGDAGYDDLDADRTGSRHRLWMLDSGWRYERDKVVP